MHSVHSSSSCSTGCAPARRRPLRDGACGSGRPGCHNGGRARHDAQLGSQPTTPA